MPAVLPAVAGAVVGGLMNKSGGGGGSTASKEPWSEVVPWLKDNIAGGQKLQAFYQNNPFNSVQQEGLQGLLDTNRTGISMFPQLMGFANQLGGTNYQRSGQRGLAYSPPGGGAAGGAQQGSPSLPAGFSAAMGGAAGAGATGAPRGMTFPQSMVSTPIDWNAMNPFSEVNNPKPAETPRTNEETEFLRRLMEQGRLASEQGVWDEYRGAGA